MLWLDVLYQKAGEITAIVYNIAGNVGIEITKGLTEIGKILGI